MKKIIMSVMALCSIHLYANAQEGDLVISNEWARPILIEGRPGGAYLNIENVGSTDDKLISATSTVSPRVEVHEHTMKDGVMKMAQVDHIEIKAGELIELKPGGYHIMLFDTTYRYSEGDQIDITLNFEKAGSITKTFNVTKQQP